MPLSVLIPRKTLSVNFCIGKVLFIPEERREKRLLYLLVAARGLLGSVGSEDTWCVNNPSPGRSALVGIVVLCDVHGLGSLDSWRTPIVGGESTRDGRHSSSEVGRSSLLKLEGRPSWSLEGVSILMTPFWTYPPRGMLFNDTLLDIAPLGCLTVLRGTSVSMTPYWTYPPRGMLFDDTLLDNAPHGCLTVLRGVSILMTPFWTYPPRGMLFNDTLLDIAPHGCLTVLRGVSILMTPFWTYPPRGMLFNDTLLDIAPLGCLTVLRGTSVSMTPYWTYPPRGMLFDDTLLDNAPHGCLTVRDACLIDDS
uniref:Uncharacterized protein n=1 Tax=Fagus sylvatica TaxID=28930 RepID=A0A2N9HRI6_FAGSY